MLYKATAKFKELGIEKSYQGLNTEDYYSLLNDSTVDLKDVPEHLIAGKYIEEVKKSKEVK